MIPLTRLNGSQIFVNCDLIKYAESSPDTMLTLVHGEKMVVLESCEEVIRRVTNHRIRMLQTLSQTLPGAVENRNAMSAASAHAALDHFSEERKEEIDPDPAPIHRRRPQQS